MVVEKKTKNHLWITGGDIRFRIEHGEQDLAIIWATISGVDLCLTLLFYDFIGRLQDNLGIVIKVNASWRGRRGFEIETDKISLLISEILAFVSHWDIEANENGDVMPDEDWYSDN